MLGDNHRLRERLVASGTHADAEVLEAKERPWVTRRAGELGAWATFRLKLAVSPAGEDPFTVELTDQWRATGEPQVGMQGSRALRPRAPLARSSSTSRPGAMRCSQPLPFRDDDD